MFNRHFALRVAAASCALIIAAGLVGCPGSSSTQNAGDEESADPRFETAESLLAYYNSLTTVEPVNAAGVFGMYRAENDQQRQYIAIARATLPIAQLDFMMYKRFGETLDPKSAGPMLAPCQAAKFTSREEGRAQAEQIDATGRKDTLYLVQADGRWWVSGFTLEYDTEFTKSFDEASMTMEQLHALQAAVRPAMEGIQHGSITSAAAARAAVAAALVSKPPTQPE